MNTKTLILLTLTTLLGCVASTMPEAEPQRVNECDPDEDLQVDAEGNTVHGVSQCALCRRFEDAFEARATELGCTERYPLDGCPIDAGLTDCVYETMDAYLESTVGAIDDCATLVRFTGQVENVGGFECGDSCTWSDPYANPVTSDVEQEVQAVIEGDWGHDACAAGTPYGER